MLETNSIEVSHLCSLGTSLRALINYGNAACGVRVETCRDGGAICALPLTRSDEAGTQLPGSLGLRST